VEELDGTVAVIAENRYPSYHVTLDLITLSHVGASSQICAAQLQPSMVTLKAEFLPLNTRPGKVCDPGANQPAKHTSLDMLAEELPSAMAGITLRLF